MVKLNQEKVWNSIAPFWDMYKKDGFGSRDKLIESFVKSSDNILDLGCGTGRNFIKNGKWYGVDFSENMLEFAGKKEIAIELKKSNLWDIPYEDEFFDKVICIAALHCVEFARNRNKTIKEIYRVLKKNGRVIITVWNKDSKRWKNKPKEKLVSWSLGDKKAKRFYYLYGFEELKSDLEKVGFRVLKHSHPLARNIVFMLEKV